jgi:hypothetical protein
MLLLLLMVMLFEIFSLFFFNKLESIQTSLESRQLINSASNDRVATSWLQTRCGVPAA